MDPEVLFLKMDYDITLLRTFFEKNVVLKWVMTLDFLDHYFEKHHPDR